MTMEIKEKLLTDNLNYKNNMYKTKPKRFSLIFFKNILYGGDLQMRELDKGRYMYGISTLIIVWSIKTYIYYMNAFSWWFNVISLTVLLHTLFQLICRIAENEYIWREK